MESVETATLLPPWHEFKLADSHWVRN